METARVTFRVRRYVSAVPAREKGTSFFLAIHIFAYHRRMR